VGVKGIVPFALPPPQPTIVMMIKARANTAAAGCLRTNACGLVSAKTNSEQAANKAMKRTAIESTMGERSEVGEGNCDPRCVVTGVQGLGPFPLPRFESAPSRASGEKLRRVAGGVGGAVGRVCVPVVVVV